MQNVNGKAYTFTYQYDKVGNRTKATYPDAKVVDYVYDLDDKVTQVKVGGVALTNYTYDPLNRRTQKDFALTPVQRSTYTYDLANQLTNLANGIVGGAGISAYGYTYDAVGNRLTMAASPGGTQTYTYDAIYQLTGVTGAQTHSYAYDKLGNRTTADSVTYTANNLNQYLTVGGVAQVYDNNGNLTSDGTATYTYDEENRLASVVKGGVTSTYRYDAFNRRVNKTVGGVATYFVHDGADIAEERDAAGALKADYVYGPLVDEPLTMSRGGATYYYFTDGLGSVRSLTNSAGTIIESYDYDAYGKTTTISTIGSPIMFTGRWYDAESGNYYYRARQYSPTVGRFLQRDPIGYYDSKNLYQYVGNNPGNLTDPSGLCPAIILTAEEAAIAEALGLSIDALKAWLAAKALEEGLAELNDGVLYSKGGKQNIRDSGLVGVSDEDIAKGARDRSLPPEVRRRYQKEEKARGKRNKQKR